MNALKAGRGALGVVKFKEGAIVDRGNDPVTTTTTAASEPHEEAREDLHAHSPEAKKLPPVIGKLLSGSFWLALKTPLQAVLSLWTLPLTVQAIGTDGNGAYGFAWGFGFFQMLFEFGMGSALQRQVSECWAKGDRAGVDRAIACGMNFYAAMALVQAAALLAVAYFAVPHSGYTKVESYNLIIKLLILQACTAPCYGTSMVVSCVLQAARRYDFLPRFELVVIVARFVVLFVGVQAGVDFFLIVVAQTALQIGLTLGPSLWVMSHELGYLPRFRGSRLDDYRPLLHISFYMFLIQISVVLADKIDTTILGFALKESGPATSVYMMVSKPFLQIRQSGWTLAYMVMPAVASLIVARDERGLERIKYDGTRLHVGVLLPVALSAWVYAAPFLTLWMGDRLGYDAARVAPLLRLFLIAVIPLVLSVPVQASLGMNRIEVVALAALGGALVNLPLSFFLTMKFGVQGVIWGTVLTTLFSNLLIPGVYVFRVLKIDFNTFLKRTLSAPMAGALALLVVTALLQWVWPLHPSEKTAASSLRWLKHAGSQVHLYGFLVLGGKSLLRWLPLASQVGVGGIAYAAGYLAVPVGRSDYVAIAGKLRRPG